MGWDSHYGFQLYQSDPSGNYCGWKATCIGTNSAVCCKQFQFNLTAYCYLINQILLQAAIASLKTEYKEGQMTLDEAKKLAVKILSKTLDATKLTADKGIIYWKLTKYLFILNY